MGVEQVVPSRLSSRPDGTGTLGAAGPAAGATHRCAPRPVRVGEIVPRESQVSAKPQARVRRRPRTPLITSG
jgi:hypothetical protein